MQGRNKRPSRHLALWGLLGAALLLAFPLASRAAEKRAKPLKLVGLATEVEANRVTIRGEKAGEITVQTKEDFREKVAVGSKVTAWYFPQDGVNLLHWLEYPLENSFVSPAQFRSQIKKIIILPSSNAGDADALFDAMGDFLRSRLGWYVAPHMLATEIRRRAREPASTLDLIDPTTGAVDLSTYVQAERDLIRSLAADTRMDAVLQADVELVQVNFRSQVAVWDGVQQPVSSKFSRAVAMLSPLPVEGHVPAATVVLKLWDSQGQLLWSNRRGFAVLALQVGITSKFRDRPIAEVLEDKASVEKWLSATFGSLLPVDSETHATLKKQ